MRVLAALAMAQDKPQAWTGSVSPSEVDMFPKGIDRGKVHFGIIQDDKVWAAVWERLGKEAPEVNFEKNVVLFVYYAQWPGGLAIGEPSIKDGVVTMEVALDGKRPKEAPKQGKETPPTPEGSEISFRCHYDYEMRVQSRSGVKALKLVSDDKELGEIALKKVE